MKNLKFLTILFIGITLVFVSACGSAANESYEVENDNETVSDYPNQPIKFIVQYGAGGGTDLTYRVILKAIEKELGQPIIVENIPAGGGLTGVQMLANADPDGYTAGVVAAGQLVHAPLFRDMPVKLEDYEMAGSFGEFLYGLIARADAPYTTFEEFIQYVKDNSGKLNASTVPATVSTVLYTWLKNEFAFEFNELPFDSSGDALKALLDGSVEFTFAISSGTNALLDAGDVKLIAAAGTKRWEKVPDVPTLIENGFENANIRTFLGIGFPKGTPRAVIERWENAINAALEDPEVIEQFKNMSVEPSYMNAEEFSNEMKALDQNLRKMLGK